MQTYFEAQPILAHGELEGLPAQQLSLTPAQVFEYFASLPHRRSVQPGMEVVNAY